MPGFQRRTSWITPCHALSCGILPPAQKSNPSFDYWLVTAKIGERERQIGALNVLHVHQRCEHTFDRRSYSKSVFSPSKLFSCQSFVGYQCMSYTLLLKQQNQVQLFHILLQWWCIILQSVSSFEKLFSWTSQTLPFIFAVWKPTLEALTKLREALAALFHDRCEKVSTPATQLMLHKLLSNRFVKLPAFKN